jgi:hypothetical protein
LFDNQIEKRQNALSFIPKRLKDGETVIAHEHADAAMLFADYFRSLFVCKS